jgi:hypothetical protein
MTLVKMYCVSIVYLDLKGYKMDAPLRAASCSNGLLSLVKIADWLRLHNIRILGIIYFLYNGSSTNVGENLFVLIYSISSS